MNSLLYYNERELKFINEKKLQDIVKIIKLLIDEADKDFEPSFTDGMFSYQWTINLWKEHILELSKEAVNNIIIGSFFSLGSLNRTIIECYAYSYCIKNFKEEKLWETWISHNINKKLNDKRFQDGMKKDFIKETLSKFKSHSVKKGENEWLRDVIQIDKNKKVTFRDICNLVHSKEENINNIYSDYQKMCDYVHGTDLFIKWLNFTFYDTYYQLIVIMFGYISKSVVTLSDSHVSIIKLNSIAYEFYALMNDIFNN